MVDPQTAYARCKVLVERELTAMVDSRFTPVFLRNATAFGASPRQRFDLVLNNLAGFAFTTGKVRVMSDGTPCRPLVHVEDICQAILCALEAPREAVCGEAFNVGTEAQNYTVREIAEIVGKTFPGCEVTYGPSGPDNRSYRVSFAKIRERIAEFQMPVERGEGRIAVEDGISTDSARRGDVQFCAVHTLVRIASPSTYGAARSTTSVDADRADRGDASCCGKFLSLCKLFLQRWARTLGAARQTSLFQHRRDVVSSISSEIALIPAVLSKRQWKAANARSGHRWCRLHWQPDSPGVD